MFELNPASDEITISSLGRCEDGLLTAAAGNEKPMANMQPDRRKSARYPCNGGVELRRKEGAATSEGERSKRGSKSEEIEQPTPAPGRKRGRTGVKTG